MKRHLKVAYAGVVVCVVLLVVAGIAVLFGVVNWLTEGLVPLAFLTIPVSWLIAAELVPTVTVPHCLMCKAGEHSSCTRPRKKWLCCCTVEPKPEDPTEALIGKYAEKDIMQTWCLRE